jgi:glycosyltransferase involved in cell wall biosynthesis
MANTTGAIEHKPVELHPDSLPARRLTVLTTGLARGGAEAQVVLLATGLTKRGWTVEVISMLPPEDYVSELLAGGVPVRDLGMRRGIPEPWAMVRLGRVLRRFRPDILHCHMVHANLLGRVARLFSPIPVLISTAHSICEGPRWRDWAYRVTDPLADLTTNVSKAGVARYVRDNLVPAHRIAWIPNGVDFDRFRPDRDSRQHIRGELGLSPDAFVWIAVGNLRDPKDYPIMLSAFSNVARRGRDSVLLIAGDGPLAHQLAQYAEELGISQRVRWLGRRSDIATLLRTADAFLMSSRYEGTPIALLEASATCLPVVATAVGGVPEVVADGVTGHLSPPGDHEALARAMEAVLAMFPDERRTMGDRGRERVMERYGIENILDMWESVYRDLLPAGAGNGAKSRVRLEALR